MMCRTGPWQHQGPLCAELAEGTTKLGGERCDGSALNPGHQPLPGAHSCIKRLLYAMDTLLGCR